MIAFYYSNKTENQISAPRESLGGFIACNKVPGNRENNVFSAISGSGTTVQYRALFLKNESEEEIKDLLFWIEEESGIQYQANAVIPNSKGQIETIERESDTPGFGSFIDVVSKRASSLLTVLQGSTLGNEILLVDGLAIQIDDPSNIQQVRDLIFDSFFNSQYTIQKVDTDKILIQWPVPLAITDPIPWSSNGSIILDIPDLSGGIDNSLPLTQSLLPEQTIGLWLCREYSVEKKNCEQLYQDFLEEVLPASILENFTLFVDYRNNTGI